MKILGESGHLLQRRCAEHTWVGVDKIQGRGDLKMQAVRGNMETESQRDW